MLRNIVVIAASLTLAFAALAACNDTDDDNDIVDDDPVTNGVDDEATNDVDDEVAEEEDEATPADDENGPLLQDDDEDGPLGQTAENDEEREVVEDSVDVELVDYEIDMPETVESGIVVFALANEGESRHGIAIESTGNDDEGGELIGAMFADAGEDAQLELELEPGDYVVFCPVGNHREDHGMETELTVE